MSKNGANGSRDPESPRAWIDSGSLRELALTASQDPPQSDCIPGFRIAREIGRGSMGVVFEAEQALPCRRVALKLLRPSFGQLVAWSRFEREAAALARLRHPGIAALYEAGVANTLHGPQPWFAMELVPGERLDAYVRGRGLDRARILKLFGQICAAIDEAHRQGVVHRDLKPANVLVEEGDRARVLDFGIARLIDADVDATTRATTSSELLGTLAYMSPEQAADGRRVDPRSDVYSLGVILYELLVGHPPHETANRTLAAALRLITEVEPLPLSAIDPKLKGDLENVVRKALDKDPARRYASASALGDDLVRHLEHRPVLARAPTLSGRVVKLARRHRALVAGCTIAIVAIVGGLIASAAGWSKTTAALTTSEQRRRAAIELVLDDLRRIEKMGEVSGALTARRDMLARAAGFISGQHLDVDARAGDPAAMDAYASFLEAQAALLLRDRKHEGVEARLQEALKLRRALSDRAPGRAELDAACMRDRRLLADAAFARGAFEQADALGKKTLAHDRAHVASHPEDARFLADLAEDERRLVDVTEKLRGPNAARDVALEWKTTCEDLARRDMRARDARLRLCEAHQRLFELASATEREDDAAACATAALDLADPLVDEFPGDVETGRALQRSLKIAGTVALAKGDFAAADRLRQRMLRLSRQLAIENPDHPEFFTAIRDHFLDADFPPVTKGDHPLLFGRRMLSIAAAAIDELPDASFGERVHAALTLLTVARCEANTGGGTRSADRFREALQRLERLERERPDDRWVASSLADALLDVEFRPTRDVARGIDLIDAQLAARPDENAAWAIAIAKRTAEQGDPATSGRILDAVERRCAELGDVNRAAIGRIRKIR